MIRVLTLPASFPRDRAYVVSGWTDAERAEYEQLTDLGKAVRLLQLAGEGRVRAVRNLSEGPTP